MRAYRPRARGLQSLALALIAIGCLMAPAGAHLLNMSRAHIELQETGNVELRLSLDLLITAGSREAYFAMSQMDDPLSEDEVRRLLRPLPAAVELTLGGVALPLTLEALRFPQLPREVFLDPLRWPRTELTLRGSLATLPEVPLDAGLRVTYTDAFRFEEPIANTFADARSQRSQTRWLVTGQTSPVFDARGWYDSSAAAPVASRIDWAGVLNFLGAGFLHILPGGIDHLLFVAGLCLGAASLLGLVGMISIFTLAHSLTLCAMALGWVTAPSQWVELLILLSILWVAMGSFRSTGSTGTRWPIVLLFGLLHGLGFAGALADIGLPAQQRMLALIAFNLGVELGQMAFLCALLAVFTLLLSLEGRRDPDARPPRADSLLPVAVAVRRTGALVIGAWTGFLLVQRLALVG